MDQQSFRAKPSSFMNRLAKKPKTQDSIIILDDDEDSDYETGSANSLSSTQSNPMGAMIVAKKKAILYYANPDYASDVLAAWQSCIYRPTSDENTEKPSKSNATPNSRTKDPKKDCEIIVINDSDDETPPPKSCDIINLDSDDETEPVACKNELIKYHTLQTQQGVVSKVPAQWVANGAPLDPLQPLEGETRVIAFRNPALCPVTYTDRKMDARRLMKQSDWPCYAGMVSNHKFFEDGTWHHLIFFDDGYVQYLPNSNIRLVFGAYDPQCVHPNARHFYNYYFKAVNESQLRELKFTLGMTVGVYLNDQLDTATVVEYDGKKMPGIVGLQFRSANHGEFLYTGSPRLQGVFKEIVRDKKLQRFHNETMIVVSSDSEDDEEEYVPPAKQILPSRSTESYQRKVKLEPELLIENYKSTEFRGRQHKCDRDCVRKFEKNRKIFEFTALKRPLLAGWQRKITGLCFYIAPCGRSFNTIETTQKYLRKTKSKLTIDCFSFSEDIDCMTDVVGYTATGSQFFLNDIIPGGHQEKLRIPVLPIADNLPLFKEYVIKNQVNPRSKKVPAILGEENNPFRSSCDCKDDCSIKSQCSCWQLTLAGSDYGYRHKRLLGKVNTGIFECNSGCKCSAKCSNRVVSPQIQQQLEIYETKDRGYGIRCQNDLPKGTFISCYFGDLLHGKTADERVMRNSGSIHGDEYFMQLDHIEIADKSKKGYESDVDDPSDLKRFKLDESLNHSVLPTANYINYFPDILKKRATEKNLRTDLYGENAVEFVVDGRHRGNISRFYNHSCQPNLFSQNVFVDTHDLRFPWLAFFASFDIPAGTELTWDYGYTVGSIEGREMYCKCGSEECRKRLL